MNIVHLIMKRVQKNVDGSLLCILDELQYSFMGHQFGHPLYFDTFEEGLDRVREIDSGICVLHAYSHLIFDIAKFNRDILRLYANKNFLFSGHIIEKPEGEFLFHEQCLIVNVDEFKKIPVSHFLSRMNFKWEIVPERSTESIHDDYSPMWLRPTTSLKPINRSSFFSSLVRVSLYEGFEVPNIPLELRNNKTYLYPDDVSASVVKALLEPDSQNAFIDFFDDYHWVKTFEAVHKKRNCLYTNCFYLNTESMEAGLKGIEKYEDIEVLYLLASGLKPLKIWSSGNFSGLTEIVFYDVSPVAIQFFQHLTTHWNGCDYIDFLAKRVPGYFDQDQYVLLESGQSVSQVDVSRGKWAELVDSFGGPQSFAAVWRYFQKTRMRFVCCDLLTQKERLQMGDCQGRKLIWYSNIFDYVPLLLKNLNKRRLFEEYKDFCSFVAGDRPDNVILGLNPISRRQAIGTMEDFKFGKEYLDTDNFIHEGSRL